MLEFEDSYFEEEVREDFTVPSMMKRVWATELELADFVVRVCREYDLAIYAGWGTLLGAIRHQGFIPWDDDIDFFMPRKDLQQLSRILTDMEAGILPTGEDIPFHIGNIYNSVDHNNLSTTIQNGRSLPLSQDLIRRYHNVPYSVGLDIFPLDYRAADQNLAEVQYDLFCILYKLGHEFDRYKAEGTLEEALTRAEEFCKVHFVRDDTLQQQIWILIDRVSSLVRPEEASCYISYFACNKYRDPSHLYSFEWFEKTLWVPFENITLPIPAGYDELLTTLYGDYKLPFRGTAGHDYPFYKKQEEFLQSIRKTS